LPEILPIICHILLIGVLVLIWLTYLAQESRLHCRISFLVLALVELKLLIFSAVGCIRSRWSDLRRAVILSLTSLLNHGLAGLVMRLVVLGIVWLAIWTIAMVRSRIGSCDWTTAERSICFLQSSSYLVQSALLSAQLVVRVD